MSQLKLHEAIALVLRENGKPLSASLIAAEINRRGLYYKKDRSLVRSSQIRLRARNYSHLFKHDGNVISLLEWGAAIEPIPPNIPEIIFPVASLMKIAADSDVSKISFLREVGFLNIGNIRNLLQHGLPSIPEINSCGVYAITAPIGYQVSFLSSEQVVKNNNVVNPWELDKLRAKWVPGVDVLYYGVACKSSHRPFSVRLSDLLEHASGNTTDRGPHKGGEIIWQLANYHNFEVWILPTDPPPVSDKLEAFLIEKFRMLKGCLPFANRNSPRFESKPL